MEGTNVELNGGLYEGYAEQLPLFALVIISNQGFSKFRQANFAFLSSNFQGEILPLN